MFGPKISMVKQSAILTFYMKIQIMLRCLYEVKITNVPILASNSLLKSMDLPEDSNLFMEFETASVS